MLNNSKLQETRTIFQYLEISLILTGAFAAARL